MNAKQTEISPLQLRIMVVMILIALPISLWWNIAQEEEAKQRLVHAKEFDRMGIYRAPNKKSFEQLIAESTHTSTSTPTPTPPPPTNSPPRPEVRQPVKTQIPTTQEWEAFLKDKNYAQVKYHLGPPDMVLNQDKTWGYSGRVMHPITEKVDTLWINFGNPKDWRTAGLVYSIRVGSGGREMRILYDTPNQVR